MVVSSIGGTVLRITFFNGGVAIVVAFSNGKAMISSMAKVTVMAFDGGVVITIRAMYHASATCTLLA